MKKLICAFSVLALVLTSCSSDSDSNSPTNPDGTLLKKLIETDVDSEVYTTNYTYNGNKLVKTVDEEGYSEKYFYTGDLITKIEFYNGADELEQTNIYAYNANQKLSTFQRLEVFSDTGSKEVFTYDGTGNASVAYYSGDLDSQTTASGTGTVTFTNGEATTVTTDFGTNTTTTYTYDAKNHPLKNVLGMGKISYSDIYAGGINHNILTETHSDRAVTWTYNYNGSNFPVTANEVDSVLGNSSFQFFYE